MNVCIGTICGKSIAYIPDMPGVNPEFMPEGIHKLIAILEKRNLDRIVAAEIKFLIEYYTLNKDILDWCEYKCNTGEIKAMYNYGNEEYFSSLDEFIVASNYHISVEAPEGNPGLGS